MLPCPLPPEWARCPADLGRCLLPPLSLPSPASSLRPYLLPLLTATQSASYLVQILTRIMMRSGT